VAARMNYFSANKHVKGHIIVSDSGGGASNAVIFISDAIKESQNLGKPVVQFIEKGGLSASAMYYIGSYSNHIISESPDNLVGSIGTMISFEGFPKNHVEPDGYVHVRAYATKSVEKNIEFEEALSGNLEPIINNVLDPVNESFLKDVQSNRPNVTEDQMSGKIFKAHEVVGTLIDQIGSFEDAVNKVMQLSKINQTAKVPHNNNKNNTNFKSQKMTLEQLRQEHPEVYSSVFNAGVLSERDRNGAWMAHSNTDLAAVKAGIESGKEISATQREEFLVKSASLSHLKNLQEDSKSDVKTPEAEAIPEVKETEVDNFYAEVDAKLKSTKK